MQIIANTKLKRVSFHQLQPEPHSDTDGYLQAVAEHETWPAGDCEIVTVAPEYEDIALGSNIGHLEDDGSITFGIQDTPEQTAARIQRRIEALQPNLTEVWQDNPAVIRLLVDLEILPAETFALLGAPY